MSKKAYSPLSTILVGLLFGAPFAGFGTFALWEAYEEYYSLNYTPKDFWGPLVGGAIFSLIGYSIIISLMRYHYYEKAVSRLKNRYPNQPGMHTPEWAKGSVSSAAKTGVVGIWIITFIWNGITAPAAFAMYDKIHRKTFESLAVVPFVLIGIYLLYLAIRATLRWYRFGNTTLKYSPPGAKPGQTFQATIKGSVDLPANSQCQITLLNIRRETVGSGKHRRVKTHTLYEEEKIIETQARNLSVGLPLTFLIPKEAQVTNTTDSDNKILWQIQVKTPLKGADFEAEYSIPVYNI